MTASALISFLREATLQVRALGIVLYCITMMVAVKLKVIEDKVGLLVIRLSIFSL